MGLTVNYQNKKGQRKKFLVSLDFDDSVNSGRICWLDTFFPSEKKERAGKWSTFFLNKVIKSHILEYSLGWSPTQYISLFIYRYQYHCSSFNRVCFMASNKFVFLHLNNLASSHCIHNLYWLLPLFQESRSLYVNMVSLFFTLVGNRAGTSDIRFGFG